MINKQKLKLTKEQYDVLNNPELEWFLRTAYNSQFITGLTNQQANTLFDIYNQIFHTKKRSTSCSQCRLEVCAALGKLYYEFQESEDINEDKTGDVSEEIKPVEEKQIKPKTKKKNGTASKTD